MAKTGGMRKRLIQLQTTQTRQHAIRFFGRHIESLDVGIPNIQTAFMLPLIGREDHLKSDEASFISKGHLVQRQILDATSTSKVVVPWICHELHRSSREATRDFRKHIQIALRIQVVPVPIRKWLYSYVLHQQPPVIRGRFQLSPLMFSVPLAPSRPAARISPTASPFRLL